MLSYDSYAPVVRRDLARAQEESWARLGRPGTWWSAEERLAIAEEVRAARWCELCRTRKAALSPYGLPGTHAAVGPYRQDRPDQVLVGPHAAGHTVHDDAETPDGHGWAQFLLRSATRFRGGQVTG